MADEEQIILPAGYIKLKYLENKVTSTGQKNAHTSVPLSFDFKLDGTGDSELIIETVHAINDVSVNDQAEGTIAGPNATSSNSDEFYWLIWNKYVATHSCAWLNPNFYPKNNEYFKVILKWTPQTSSIDVIDSDGTSYYAEKPSNSNWRCENMGIFHKLVELSGSAAYKSLSGKKKYWKAWKNGELIYNLIPCLDRNYEPCFYDTISGQSFYNTNSSGSFTYQIDDKHLGILHKLPEGFKHVKYLISSGYQYIDTNYIPTNETGYYLEGQSYSNSESYWFGARNDSTSDTRIYIRSHPKIGWGWMTHGDLTTDTQYFRQELKAEFNFLNSRKLLTIINEKDFIYNLTDLNFVPSQSVFIFNFNSGGVPYEGLGHKGRIDTFLISEGDQIVRQFVPCLDEDGIPCMYELYTGTVHYNQGSGQFSYPREYTNDPINLPAGYTKCVYLQSDGTQWIDTQFIANEDTGLYLKTLHLNNGNYISFGSGESGKAYYAPRINISSKQMAYCYGSSAVATFYYDKGDDLIYTSTMNLYNDKTVTFISEDTKWSGILTNAANAASCSLWLFSWNKNTGSIDQTYGKFGGRIFRAKITQGDTLIRDFVPCLDTDNRPCMYDLVTQEPYYNQSGGVEFTYCVEHQLPSNFLKLDYLEDTDTQYINTGIVPTNETGLYVDAQQITHTNTHVMGSGLDTNSTGFGVPRLLKSSGNTAGFMWKSWTSYGNFATGTRFESYTNLYNNRKANLKSPTTTERTNTLGDLGFTPTATIHMFRTNYTGHGGWNGRIYRAKITQGTELIRDYVPAYDALKDKPCMYDLINNVAYYNDGTGEFIMPPKREGSYTGFAQLGGIGNRLGSNGITDYEDDDTVSCLMLNENEYLKTGIVPTENYKIEIDCIIHEVSNDSSAQTSLIYHSNENQLLIVTLFGYTDNSSDGSMFMAGIGKLKNGSIILKEEERGIYCLKLGRWRENDEVTFTFNNENIIESTGIVEMGTSAFRPFSDSIYVGYNPLTKYVPRKITIYGIKIYDEYGNIISDMIPYEENEEKGLYCLIRNEFIQVETNE